MKYGEKIRAARKAAGLTQQQLAKKIGVSMRTVQFYESNKKQPRNAAVFIGIAEAVGLDTDYFLSTEEIERIREQDAFLSTAAEKHGSRGKAQAQLLLDQTNALFTGGDLDEADRDAFFRAMSEIYFDAKIKAKKFTPKKHRKSDDE